MLFAEFLNKNQDEFLLEIKNKTNLSWDKLAKKVGIRRSTLFYYLKNKIRMPKQKCDSLCRMAEISETKYLTRLINLNYTQNKIKSPKLSKKLSEFLGILSGDGCILNKPYSIIIVSHRLLDKYFIEVYLYNLIKDLFDICPKIYYQDNSVRCVVYSKKLVKFLNEKHGFPIGKKKARLNIPHYITKNKLLLKHYLRGLFDTDGSFYGRRKNEPVIQYISGDTSFINQVKLALKSLNFNFGLNNKNLYLYNRKQIANFFKIINPSNKKHIIKFDIFKKEGKIPKTIELLNKYSRELFNG